MFNSSTYIKRRKAFLTALQNRGLHNGVVLLLANDESPRNYAANCYPFRQDSSWLYLIGIELPGLACTINIESGETCLYTTEPEIDEIIGLGHFLLQKNLPTLQGLNVLHHMLHCRVRYKCCKQKKYQIFLLPAYRNEQKARYIQLFGDPQFAHAEFIARSIDRGDSRARRTSGR